MKTKLTESELRSRLRQAGMRATRPRLLVYGALREAGGHRTVDEVVGWLAERGRPLPRMSVYNAVSDLSAAELVMQADRGPGAAIYEVSDVWHHHFVCRVCAAVQDVPCVVGSKPCLEPPATLRATVDEAQVIFRGVCAACAEKAARAAKGS